MAIFDHFRQLSDSLTLCTKVFDVGAPVDIFTYIGSSLTSVFHPSFALLAESFIGDAPAFSVSITQSVILKKTLTFVK